MNQELINCYNDNFRNIRADMLELQRQINELRVQLSKQKD